MSEKSVAKRELRLWRKREKYKAMIEAAKKTSTPESSFHEPGSYR